MKTIAAVFAAVAALFLVLAAGPMFLTWHPNEWGKSHLFAPFSSNWSAAVWVGGSLEDRADLRLREDTHHCVASYVGPIGVAYCGPYVPRGEDI
jgi:hypothetical protein